MDPAVLDSGSGVCKAGFASPEGPPAVAATAAVRRAEGAEEDAAWVWPVQRGQVVAWGEAEALWRWALYEQLGWVEGEEGPLLLTEPALTSKYARERATQVLFEDFNVAGLYIAEQAPISCFAVGRLTATVIDIGHGKIDIVPVVEGVAVSSAAQRLRLGSGDITDMLMRELGRRGHTVDTHAAMDLKEQISKTAASASDYDRLRSEPTDGAAPMQEEEHTLPDGQIIRTAREGWDCGEALFRPADFLGTEYAEYCLPIAVYNSIMSCHMDQRRNLFENLLLCGGCSTIPGLPERFLSEISDLAPPSFRPALVKPPEYMPDATLQFSAWIGGAILAKIVFPQNQHVTKFDYDETGPGVVHRKCF
eukprot:jgi/Chlat1/709/Chrsp104S01204